MIELLKKLFVDHDKEYDTIQIDDLEDGTILITVENEFTIAEVQLDRDDVTELRDALTKYLESTK
jgi:hypothetical protein